MKKFNFFIILMIIFCANAQKAPDLQKIKTNVQDKTSPYFYEKLVYQFNYDPSLIDSVEAKHLYYGQLYTDFKSVNYNRKSEGEQSLRVLIDQKKLDEAIEYGEQKLRNSPADLETLGLLMYAFVNKGLDKQELTYLRAAQFRKMIDAIFAGNSGDNAHSVFTVTSVTDEYILAGILNLDLKNFRRRTKFNDLGALDYFKKGKKKISFQVIYDK